MRCYDERVECEERAWRGRGLERSRVDERKRRRERERLVGMAKLSSELVD